MLTSIFSILLLITSLSYSENWQAPQGAAKAISTKDYKKHELQGDRFTEAWSYQFFLSNGTKAYVTYSLNNLPIKGKVFGGELSLYNYKGKNKSVSREYPIHRFAWKNEIKGMELTSKGTRMAVEGLPGKGHRVYYQTDKNQGFLLDLKFESAIAGKIIGDGVFRKGKAFFGQAIHIPQGRVTGILIVGKDTLQVKGVGVLEHTWQNILVSDLAAHAIQVFESNRLSGKLLLTENEYGEEILGYGMLNDGGTWKAELFTNFMNAGKKMTANSKLPKNIKISTASKTVSFKRKKDQQVYSPLDNIDGFFAKKAVKIALGEIKVRRGKSEGIEYSLMEK